ncbi:MAG: AAA family ATPase [Muribaculaceae bacterium]|nr:AAA family ATPase [Muribaculaceae bacterium]
MLIGREKELKLLREAYDNEYSQFVVVYGRRRVGKTFLVREAFNYKFTFQHSGIANTSKHTQLEEWGKSLQKQGLKLKTSPKNWMEAFSLLDDLICKSRAKRKVVFIDELPWMDTQGSGFIPALEHFWNAYASARKDVLLIVCGSATSWIVDKLIHNHGGLHNRINKKINLRQFTLHECELYAKSRKLSMQHRQILECYMIMGGIPYYWSLLRKDLSLPQNIDSIFFSEDGDLNNEFDALYRALFKKPEAYIEVINALGKKRIGMTRDEISLTTNLAPNGALTTILKNLEYCGFIRKYHQIGKLTKDAIYQLVDFYTLFYFKFILENKRHDPNFWTKNAGSVLYNNWCGLAFERVCFAHIPQIKQALGIGGVVTNEYTWFVRKTDNLPGAQIDLLLDRGDSTINICEIKYTISSEYSLNEEEEIKILNRRERFIQETKTTKAVHLTLITTRGLMHNSHSDIFQNVIVADSLFSI